MSRDHQPIVLDVINGLFDRSEFDDAVPKDHLSIANNLEFSQRGFRTRRGTSLHTAIGTAVRLAIYKRVNEVPRLIILTSTGDLYDSTNLTVPILSIPEMVDFSLVPFFNRVYITPHNRDRGLENEVVYVYDGTTCRPAGGVAPSGTLIVTNSPLSGNVDQGTHLIAVAFETESGFVTKPGPAIYGSVLADGSHQIQVDDIPIGPAGTVARRLLASRRIPSYDGNQLGYELYFIPEGRIANNVDTIATVNFFDADLVLSADYLHDQMPEIPAGVGIGHYQNSLLVWGTYNDPSVVYVSRQNDPESVDAVNGYITVDPTEAGGVKNCAEFRDSLYIYKSPRTYQTARDSLNPDQALFWKVNDIDEGIGTECFGIAEILDTKGPNTDHILVASRAGITLFNGAYQNPEFTWKIESVWKTIDFTEFDKIQIYSNPTARKLYVLLPGLNSILFGDYQNGMDFMAVRWSIWTFPWTISAICMDIHESTKVAKLLLIGDGDIYQCTGGCPYNDAGEAILGVAKYSPQSIEFPVKVMHFHQIQIRGLGVGNLDLEISGLDDVKVVNPRAIAMTETPGKLLNRLINFQDNKIALQVSTNAFNERFDILETKLFATPLWQETPNVT